MTAPAPVAVAAYIVGYAVIDDDRRVVCITTSRTVAERLAELVEIHGLADVPDTLEGLDSL
jgi:hypothetical protein